MSSVIYYKFRAAQDYDKVTFEGTSLSVWELKQEIAKAKKLGPMEEYDLEIANAQTGQEYGEGGAVAGASIPRNASVLVKRVPVAPNKRRAVMERVVEARPAVQVKARSSAVGDEEEEIAKMMKESDQAWLENQAETAPAQLSFQRKRQRSVLGRRAAAMLAVPPNYICFRCGNKGHHISACPTLGDPAYDKVRVRRTTGIPKIFLRGLQEGEQPPAGGELLITPTGERVIAVANDQEWKARHREEKAPPRNLVCPACHRLYQEPIRVPCCLERYCEECIRGLISCPGCKAPLGRDLRLDKDLSERCRQWKMRNK